MKALVLLLFVSALCLAQGARRSCEVAGDCGDDTGMTVCWSDTCHRPIPCNKNDDCYFYGSANVPRFLCYVVPGMEWPEGYGTCVEEEIGNAKYELLPEGYNALS